MGWLLALHTLPLASLVVRVLELGQYVAPAYAGMLLAEQGCAVDKWVGPKLDPIQTLDHGAELWTWINKGKLVLRSDVPRDLHRHIGQYDAIIDNFRPSTLERWGINPCELATTHDLVWVSLRSEVGEYSFDVIAQARSIMEYTPWVPFYLGDTAPGLMLAFKVLAMHALLRTGHFTIGQATALHKLVEGELMDFTADASFKRDGTRWESPETYRADGLGAHVLYRDLQIDEPIRRRAWKLENLWHDGNGRLCV